MSAFSSSSVHAVSHAGNVTLTEVAAVATPDAAPAISSDSDDAANDLDDDVEVKQPVPVNNLYNKPKLKKKKAMSGVFGRMNANMQ